jgi:hypothetical protein
MTIWCGWPLHRLNFMLGLIVTEFGNRHVDELHQ